MTKRRKPKDDEAVQADADAVDAELGGTNVVAGETKAPPSDTDAPECELRPLHTIALTPGGGPVVIEHYENGKIVSKVVNAERIVPTGRNARPEHAGITLFHAGTHIEMHFGGEASCIPFSQVRSWAWAPPRKPEEAPVE